VNRVQSLVVDIGCLHFLCLTLLVEFEQKLRSVRWNLGPKILVRGRPSDQNSHSDRKDELTVVEIAIEFSLPAACLDDGKSPT
jgi:hypothetical protein